MQFINKSIFGIFIFAVVLVATSGRPQFHSYFWNHYYPDPSYLFPIYSQPQLEPIISQKESEYFRGNFPNPNEEDRFAQSSPRVVFNLLNNGGLLNLTYSKTTTTSTVIVTTFCTTSTAALTTCTPGAKRRREIFYQDALNDGLHRGTSGNDEDLFEKKEGKTSENLYVDVTDMNGEEQNMDINEKAYPFIESSIQVKRSSLNLVSFVVSTLTSTVTSTSTSTLTAICSSTTGYPICSSSG